MDRVKRIAHQILEIHGDSFTGDFEKNKEVLNQVAHIRSKQLRNEVVGVITRLVKMGAPKEEPEKREATLTEVAKA